MAQVILFSKVSICTFQYNQSTLLRDLSLSIAQYVIPVSLPVSLPVTIYHLEAYSVPAVEVRELSSGLTDDWSFVVVLLYFLVKPYGVTFQKMEVPLSYLFTFSVTVRFFNLIQ